MPNLPHPLVQEGLEYLLLLVGLVQEGQVLGHGGLHAATGLVFDL